MRDLFTYTSEYPLRDSGQVVGNQYDTQDTATLSGIYAVTDRVSLTASLRTEHLTNYVSDQTANVNLLRNVTSSFSGPDASARAFGRQDWERI